MVFVITLLVPSNDAYAGSNGQQLRIKTYAMSQVTISGKNQNGQYQTLSQYTWDGNVETKGWWWVGKVYIRTAPLGKNFIKKDCTVEVPKSQNDNWVFKQCY